MGPLRTRGTMQPVDRIQVFSCRVIDLIAFNLSIGSAIHLAAGGSYPIGRALGSR